jgi:activator of HSP90 ATPase
MITRQNLESMMTDQNNLAVQADAPSRRQAIVGFALALGGLALGSSKARADADEEISRTEEAIHQRAFFKASRRRVYEALTETKQFNRVTELSAAMSSGMSLAKVPTQIDREAGGAFSLFGGYIVGRQVELVPNERIVQAWRVARWNSGVYSIARYEITEQGPGTLIVFDHTGFPKGEAEHLAAGWKANYWEPLEKFLA